MLTQPHIAELLLDLLDYRETQDLGALRLLEPACGEGAFVIPAARRLVQSAQKYGLPAERLGDCLQAWDVDPQQVAITQQRLTAALRSWGLSTQVAHRLCQAWIRVGDFLLEPLPCGFDVVVGNPPYVRIEELGKTERAAYRARYTTLFDRADVYVAFVERALSLLSARGLLSFVCADRWTKNRYGAKLRRLISERFAVHTYIDLGSSAPFVDSVTAYPSIFVIGRKTDAPSQPVTVVTMTEGSEPACAALRRSLQDAAPPTTDFQPTIQIEKRAGWFSGDAPWILLHARQRDVLAQLEQTQPLLSDIPSVRVGIGVATGLDAVFVVDQEQAAKLESDRTVPLVLRHDVQDGQFAWSGHSVISTFDDSGQIIRLSDHPRLRAYLEAHKARLSARHIAKSGRPWFRTIDRVFPALVHAPKLLIPDIARSLEVTLESGQFYPHHNLYVVTGDLVDLEVLGALLRSRVAQFVVSAYAVKMRGGYKRMQAQYLRKIRVPQPSTLPTALQDDLRHAFRQRNQAEVDALSLVAYGLRELPPIP